MTETNHAVPAFRVETGSRASRIAGALVLLLLVAGCSMPFWAEPARLRGLAEFFYVLALAQMWNLLAGYGGMVSIGQQAFVGIGGYTLVVLGLHAGLNPFLAVPAGGLVAGLLALPAGCLLFRLRGAYFAIGSWVVAEVFRLVIANITAVGGGSGLSVTRAVATIPSWWRQSLTFWCALLLGAGATFLVYALLRSRYGLALTAVRDSERASASLGVGVRKVKWFVYVASAVGCGMVGALIFITKLRISPDAAFSPDWSALMFFAVVIGGIGTIEGPILGALLYFALREWLGGFGTWYLIALGLLTIAVMLWAPKGLWGTLVARYDWRLFPVQRRLRPVVADQEAKPLTASRARGTACRPRGSLP